MCDSGRGQVLAPWPNRLGDGRYHFEGRDGLAALDEPARHNAIHGLVRWTAWHVVSRAQNALDPRMLAPPPTGITAGASSSSTSTDWGATASPCRRARPTSPCPSPLRHRLPPRPDALDADRLDLTGHPGPAPARHRRTGPAHLDQPGDRDPSSISPHPVGSATPSDTAFTHFRRDPDGMARVELDDTAGGGGITVRMTSTSATSWCSPATRSNRSAGAAPRSPSSQCRARPTCFAPGWTSCASSPARRGAAAGASTPAEPCQGAAPDPDVAVLGTKRCPSVVGGGRPAGQIALGVRAPEVDQAVRCSRGRCPGPPRSG